MVCCFSFITYGLCAPVKKWHLKEITGGCWLVVDLNPLVFMFLVRRGGPGEVFRVVVTCVADV